MLSRWSDSDEPALNVLSLQAEQNFGKSFLARVVSDHLLDEYRTNPQICVAYYVFREDATDVRDFINRAVKAIL